MVVCNLKPWGTANFKVQHNRRQSCNRKHFAQQSTSSEFAAVQPQGTANFKMKWDKQSKHECYINVETVKNVTRSYTGETIRVLVRCFIWRATL